MGAATHAGVVGADDFFALELHGRLFHIHVLVDELDEVEFNGDLILPGRDDDFAALHDAFVVHFEPVIERAAGRFDEPYADAGFGSEFLRWFGLKRFLFQEIDRLVDGVENFDCLGEVVVKNIVGREQGDRFRGVVFGARVKTGAVDIEARNRADAVGFSIEGVGGSLRIRKDDVFKVVAIASLVDDESFHIPEVAFEVGECAVSKGGVVALPHERRRIVGEYLDETEHSRANILELDDDFGDGFRVWNLSEAARHRERRMDASSGDGDREVVAGGFYGEGVVQELMLERIVIVEAQERVFPEEVGETEEVEMECVIANDQSVIGERAEEHRLFAWDDAERLLDRLDARDQMRVGAGAADAREKLGNRGDRLAFHGVRVEAFEFLDGEFHFFYGAVFDKHIETGRPFDFGEFFDAELTQLGYLMHRIGNKRRRVSSGEFLLIGFYSGVTIPNSRSILLTTARKEDSTMGQPWTRSSTVTTSSSFFTFSP